MKKFYLFTVLVALVLSVTAQELPQLEKLSPDAKEKFVTRSNTKATEVGWLTPPWDLLENFYGGFTLANHYANFIFPDSTVNYISGGNLQRNWLTSVGTVLDPYSPIFGTKTVPYGAPYHLDSMSVLAWYEKVAQTASYVDTLQIEIVWGERMPLSDPPFRRVHIANPPDTMFFAAPSMMASTAQYGAGPGLTWPGKHVIKYPLTMSDTTLSSGKYIEFPVGLTIPSACIVATNLTFIPGYPYNFNDTIFEYGGNTLGTKNAFRVSLFATADPTSNADLFYDPFGYYNLAYIIHKSGRYGLYANQLLNEIMYPQTGWGFGIGFKLSVNAGIEDVEKGQISVYPNPANDILNIKLSKSGNAQIQIIDLVGRVVSNVQTSEMLSTIQLDNLAKGLYLVRVTQGSEVYTTKVLVK